MTAEQEKELLEKLAVMERDCSIDVTQFGLPVIYTTPEKLASVQVPSVPCIIKVVHE